MPGSDQNNVSSVSSLHCQDLRWPYQHSALPWIRKHYAEHLMALVKLMQNQEYFCIDAIKSIQKVLLHFFVNFVCLCIDGVGINSSE